MLSIIVPCMNEESTISIFYHEVLKVMQKELEIPFEILFINDGSKDTSLTVMKELSQLDERVSYLSFSKNFGKEAAIYAGLENSSGDYIVIMDVDLQDPPHLLPEMYQIISETDYDSVATRRVNRQGELSIRSFFSRLFYKLINKISSTEIMDGARDYRMMNRKYVNALLLLSEKVRFSKGLFSWVGFKTKWLEFENIERSAGETKWSFWKLFIYAIDGITAFSVAPLRVSVITGFICSLFSFLMLIFIVIRQLLFGDPVVGWASTISIILFIGGLQIFFIGIIGEYLAKIFMEIKNRPIYILDETNLKKDKLK
ncbi:MAG: glycosyltransferase family 2 protein [Lactovum sp.]